MSYFVDNYRTYQPMNIEYPLIHTVQEFEILEKIIIEGFRPSYCTEYLSDNERQIKAAFPMVSFSNMSLEESMRLSKSYGTFAIAMKKAWASKTKLNPVLYLERHSDFTYHIISSFERIKNFTDWEIESSLNGGLIGDQHILVKTLIDLFSLSKNFDGKLIRNNIIINERYPFGLEREWRYVVTEEKYRRYLIKDEIEMKWDYSEQINHIRLGFSLEDISAIIVETDYERDVVSNLLLNKYGESKYKPTIIINDTRHIYDNS